MQKFYIKQRVFTFKDKFSIYDENQKEIYYAKGNLGIIRKKLWLYDKRDKEIAFLKQKLLDFYPAKLPTFLIYMDDKKIGRIRKKFTFFKRRLLVSYRDWKINGSFFGFEYFIMEGEKTIAQISKAILAWGDTYEIAVNDEKNVNYVLALVIGIDGINAITSRRNCTD